MLIAFICLFLCSVEDYVSTQFTTSRKINTLFNKLVNKDYYGCALRYIKIVSPDTHTPEIPELNDMMKKHNIPSELREMVKFEIECGEGKNGLGWNINNADGSQYLHHIGYRMEAGNKQVFYLTLFNRIAIVFTIAMIKLQFITQKKPVVYLLSSTTNELQTKTISNNNNNNNNSKVPTLPAPPTAEDQQAEEATNVDEPKNSKQ